MESARKGKRYGPKAAEASAFLDPEARRRAFLQRQSLKRADRVNKLRGAMIADADDDAEAAENAQFIAAEAIVESLVGSIEDSFTDAFGYDTPSVDKSAAVTAGSNGAHAGLQSALAVAVASHDMMDDGPHQPAATPSSSKAPAIPVAKRLQPSTSARRYWANEICRPEMMTSVPRDLRGATGMVHDGDEGEDDDGMEIAGTSSSSSSSSMLLSDSGGWMAVPRPEGTHCLVVAGKGITIARDTNGSIIHRFMSALPGGSPHSNDGHGPALHHHGHHQPTILECVYIDLAGLLRDDDAVGDDEEEDESGLNSAEAGRGAPSSLAVAGASPLPTATNNSSSRSSPLHAPPPSASSCTGVFVVLDLLAWRGMSYYDTPFEFRRFWSEQKLAEVDVGRVHGAVTDADVDAALSAAAAVSGGGGYASNPPSGRATPAFDSATAHQAASYIHLNGTGSAGTAGQTLDAGAGSNGGGMDVEDDDGGDDMTQSVTTTTAATGGNNIQSFSSLSSLAALMTANNHTSSSNNHIDHVSAPTAPATTAATTASHVIRRVLASATRGPINEVPFILAPVFDCSTNNGSSGAGIGNAGANPPDGILAAYKFEYGSLLRSAGLAFPVSLSPSASAATATGRKDGLLFYYKSSHYECGPNPLVMHWRDAACSRRSSQRHASSTMADAADASGSNSSSCTCRAMSCPGLAVGHHHHHHQNQQYQQHVYGMGAPGVVLPLPSFSAAAATTATITTPASRHHWQHWHQPHAHRQHQRPLRVTLELTKALALTTADGVHLGAMDPNSSLMTTVAASLDTAGGATGSLSNGAAASALTSSSCAVGDLLCFDVDGIDGGDGFGFDCGTPLPRSNATIACGPGAVPLPSSSPRLVNARYTHKAPHHRMHADSWSAILWRHMGRHGRTPTIQDLVQSQRR